MARFSAGGRSTSIGTNLLPAWAAVASANVEFRILEIGIFNTTVTACTVALQRMTSAGTPGAAVTSLPHNTDSPAATTTIKNTYTSAGPTLTAGLLYNATLGAAVGSGIIWTFGGEGLIVPKGVTNGVGMTVPVGAGQIVDFYIVYEE